MNNPQMYAVEIEHIMSSVFHCDRFGIGGIVNSDCIRRNPYFSMVSTLTFVYANSDAEKKRQIEQFIDDFSYYSNWNIDTILSFETNRKIVDGSDYQIDYPNGEKAIESIIEQFKNICK